MIDPRISRRALRQFAVLAAITLAHASTTVGAPPPSDASPGEIRDKTLVVWAELASTTQRGGSVLTLENLPGQFDGVVFGEIEPARWMAGSDFFARTATAQAAWPAETATPGTLVQIAVRYAGRDVAIFRDGKPYGHYTMASEPVAFDRRSLVLMGLRHWEVMGGPTFRGAIADARIYASALDPKALAELKPDQDVGPRPLAWWTFEDGTARDRMGTYPPGRLVGAATISGGRLRLDGGFLVAGVDPPRARTRQEEDWPTYHIAALPEEGLCRPYDANGCIYWKGKYHLMYIYQDPSRPHGGHSWGHAVSTDLVNWTFIAPAVVPEPGDPDVGIFSGNAFINKDGVPMLCWFGINAGVCVATAEDDDLVRWMKHPRNPIVPIPKPGQPGHGVYTVWDPYLWLEGDTYYCLLGGNNLRGKDTLYTMSSPDMVNWKPLHPFYEQPDPNWTTAGEDCSCPDFFKLGDKHVLLCISHKVGARAYIGRFDRGRFFPETHVRMNWPGGQFFAPESLLDGKGRRIIWAWVTDPRTITTQQATGSGVQSLPRVLTLAHDGTLEIRPAEELEVLRRNPRRLEKLALSPEVEMRPDSIRGDTLELALEIDPGTAREVGLIVRASPGGEEETAIWYRRDSATLAIDSSRSTRRDDVVYTQGPLDSGGIRRGSDNRHPRNIVEAPLTLTPDEPLRLRVFLDKPMLEVFANDRQCVTQQVFPSRKDSLGIALRTRGGSATVRKLDAWDMAPATFTNRKKG